jgi:polyadenylate-binding protein
MSAPSTYQSASLYVGDLIPDVTEALLYEVFSQLGPVASIRVCRDAVTRRSLGYAYVNFHNAVDAERALDTINYTNIPVKPDPRGKPCRIMWSQRDPALRKSGAGNIFVKSLDTSIDSKTLYDTFSIFGNILSCKVSTNGKAESLGYGFVQFETQESSQKAIENVNGMMIASKQVSVEVFKPKNERIGAEALRFTNLYVKDLPQSFTDEKLYKLFAAFGTVTSHFLPFKDGVCRCFGFANFKTHEEAVAAIQGLHDTELEGKKLYVVPAQKKGDRQKELNARHEVHKLEPQKNVGNLYVKNFDENVDENALRQEFAKFGNITSCAIVKDAAGRSKGFGFVSFSTPEEATKALTEMSRKLIGGKPLYVSLFQSKEQRRVQNEARAVAQSMRYANPMGFPPGAPMFYHQPRPNGFMYPQMGMRPNNFMSRGVPMMGMRPNGFMPMQMDPNQPRPPMQAFRGRGGPMRGTRGGRGGSIKYVPNARNQPQVPSSAAPAAASPAAAPLTLETLSSQKPEIQKQVIGERLYPLIAAKQPDLAGKLTGMLLEMDNGELLHLLDSDESLQEKITEGMQVLHEHALMAGNNDL